MSSANIAIGEKERQFERSLMKSIKSIGPRTDPRGTPERTLSQGLEIPLMTTRCRRDDK